MVQGAVVSYHAGTIITSVNLRWRESFKRLGGGLRGLRIGPRPDGSLGPSARDFLHSTVYAKKAMLPKPHTTAGEGRTALRESGLANSGEKEKKPSWE